MQKDYLPGFYKQKEGSYRYGAVWFYYFGKGKLMVRCFFDDSLRFVTLSSENYDTWFNSFYERLK